LWNPNDLGTGIATAIRPGIMYRVRRDSRTQLPNDLGCMTPAGLGRQNPAVSSKPVLFAMGWNRGCPSVCVQIDIEGALSCHSIRDIDEALLVPAYGFKSVDEVGRSWGC
jgi:hypothetical protein